MPRGLTHLCHSYSAPQSARATASTATYEGRPSSPAEATLPSPGPAVAPSTPKAAALSCGSTTPLPWPWPASPQPQLHTGGCCRGRHLAMAEGAGGDAEEQPAELRVI